MIIFTKKAIVVIVLTTAFSLGFMMFLSWSAVYAINVEGEAIAYLDAFQEGRTVVEDYLSKQRQTYGDTADFGETVSVTQKFTINSDSCQSISQAAALLAANTTLTVEAAVIMVENEKVAALADKSAAEAVLNSFKEEKKVIGEAVEVISREFSGDVKIVTCRVPAEEIVSQSQARTLLKDSPGFMSNAANVIVEYRETVVIDEGTTVIPSDSLPQGAKETVAEGRRGELEKTVRSVVSDEGISQSQVLSSEMVTEPRSSVVIAGTATVFYDIAANGGLGAYGSSGQLWANDHTGTDIAAPAGTAVCSLGKGIVTAAGWNGAYGNMVTIDHGNGVETRYGHLESIEVTVGDEVDIGTELGKC
ncbi:MAG: peptidoglycan DD-metalloendopeptidase family protein, partial [Bacillota bacterium]|nr:peptidoglycan DD-metalloendopeptidase family protein [Bacillota bacterium]